MLPLTLPQFFLALILGYLRVNHGLWASMTFHALHNCVFIGLVLVAGGA
jgi:membrane protease YdiL (CAAX protease family)